LAKPVTYSTEIIDKIAEMVASGKTIPAIGRISGMPSATTIYKWMKSHEYASISIREARREATNADYDKLLEIEQKLLTRKISPNAARTLIESVWKRLKALNPQDYGDKIDHTVNVVHRLDPQTSEMIDKIGDFVVNQLMDNNEQLEDDRMPLLDVECTEDTEIIE
jgi:transposase-like protein